MRNPAFVEGWDRVTAPPPEESGTLIEQHIGVDAQLLEAGNHAGATYHELVEFTDAARRGSAPAVTLSDGSKAVLMGAAAHRSIDSGRPVLWSEMLAEFERAS